MISNKEADRKERIFIYYEVFRANLVIFQVFRGFFRYFSFWQKTRNDENLSRLMKGIEKIWRIANFTCAWKISELLHEKVLFLLFNLLFHEKLLANNETPYIYMQNPEKHHYHSPLPRLYNAINKEKYDKSGKCEMIISLVKYFCQKDKLLYENIYPLIKRKCYSDISVCV